MLNSLENGQFFSDEEAKRLEDLGLWQRSHRAPAKLAFAGLMLAPIMQIVELDKITSQGEFTVIKEYVRRLEYEFSLATEEDLEAIGTEMGMLPMVGGGWTDAQFEEARRLLAGALNHLDGAEMQQVRNALAKGAWDIARAGSGHLINTHRVDRAARELLTHIVTELRLESTPEGLRLLGK